MKKLRKGDLATVRSTGTPVRVLATFGNNVLAARASNGLQWTYTRDQLDQVEPEVCPI